MDDFRRQLNAAFDKKVIGALEQVARQTAIAVDGDLFNDTPVDTGRAQSNWIPSLNEKSSLTVEPGQKPPVSGALSGYKVNDTIWFTNNLPYIQRLNEGHSLKAPAGFVDAVVQRGKVYAQALAKNVSKR